MLRIGSVTSLVHLYLHQAIIDVIGNRVDIPLVIDVENSRHIWDMVNQNRYDLGLVFGSPRMNDKNAVLPHNSNAVAAMAPGHYLASRDVITPHDLLDERVLIPGRNSPLRLALDRAFYMQGHQPVSTMEKSMLNCCYFAGPAWGGYSGPNKPPLSRCSGAGHTVRAENRGVLLRYPSQWRP